MYWIVDGACFCAGVIAFGLTLGYDMAYLCWTGPVWIAIYPLLLELISNMAASMGEKVQYPAQVRSRFVYSPAYNITFCGIEKCHPFDS